MTSLIFLCVGLFWVLTSLPYLVSPARTRRRLLKKMKKKAGPDSPGEAPAVPTKRAVRGFLAYQAFWVCLGIFFIVRANPRLYYVPDSEVSSIQQAFEGMDHDPDAPDLKSAVDLMMLSHLESGRVVGAVVGVISASGAEVFGYGRVSLGDKRTPNGDTLFEIGSITKVFTATLLADLEKQGKVKPDDPVQNAFPDSVRIPKSGTREITYRDLMTHTSGLSRMPDDFMPLWKVFLTSQMRNPYVDYAPDDLYAFLNNHTLERAPGVELEYSNLGAGLLGHAIEVMTGEGYEDLVKNRICEPLGMNDTTITLIETARSRLAPGYDKVFHASPLALGFPANNWDFDVLAGCGALRSTANDMLRFLGANLGLIETDLLPVLESTHELLFPGKHGFRMGYGWILQDREETGEPVVWHNGGTGGYRSYMGFLKKRRVGVIVIVNTTQDVDVAGIGILQALADAG